MTLFLFLILFSLPSALWGGDTDPVDLQGYQQLQEDGRTEADILPRASDETASSEFREEFDPLSLLGLTPERIVELFGAPAEVFSYRGPSAGEDNVVFYYPSHIYLFFFRNRVWQVRTDHRYGRPVMGISMGDTLEEVENRLGMPFAQMENSRIYLLPYKNYPVRARLFFRGRILEDLYIYRSDY